MHTAEVVGDCAQARARPDAGGTGRRPAIRNQDARGGAPRRRRAAGIGPGSGRSSPCWCSARILLFIVVSVADALSNLRRERAMWSAPAGDGETWAAGPWPPGPEPGLDAEHGNGSNGGPGDDGGAVDLFPDPDPAASAPSRSRTRRRAVRPGAAPARGLSLAQPPAGAASASRSWTAYSARPRPACRRPSPSPWPSARACRCPAPLPFRASLSLRRALPRGLITEPHLAGLRRRASTQCAPAWSSSAAALPRAVP